ncbi:hypothetical protein FC072_20160 [Vibrio tasmaniensis]|uniref:LPD7 domain-containing protein n=1 Tax=Vibrio tasmaniensis TaxID=212663 RepID=UPI0010BDC29F|nr:LPD7 domain-containing protein [Vibrio tasmaniensis]TKG59170.1 hypothetical protein FC072_20160 [Vibrio tasmaniensis]
MGGFGAKARQAIKEANRQAEIQGEEDEEIISSDALVSTSEPAVEQVTEVEESQEAELEESQDADLEGSQEADLEESVIEANQISNSDKLHSAIELTLEVANENEIYLNSSDVEVEKSLACSTKINSALIQLEDLIEHVDSSELESHKVGLLKIKDLNFVNIGAAISDSLSEYLDNIEPPSINDDSEEQAQKNESSLAYANKLIQNMSRLNTPLEAMIRNKTIDSKADDLIKNQNNLQSVVSKTLTKLQDASLDEHETFHQIKDLSKSINANIETIKEIRNKQTSASQTVDVNNQNYDQPAGSNIEYPQEKSDISANSVHSEIEFDDELPINPNAASDTLDTVAWVQPEFSRNNKKSISIAQSVFKGVERTMAIKKSIFMSDMHRGIKYNDDHAEHNLRFNGVIKDYGDMFKFTGTSRKANAKHAVKLAEQLGWNTIAVSGNANYIEKVSMLASKKGIQVIEIDTRIHTQEFTKPTEKVTSRDLKSLKEDIPPKVVKPITDKGLSGTLASSQGINKEAEMEEQSPRNNSRIQISM